MNFLLSMSTAWLQRGCDSWTESTQPRDTDSSDRLHCKRGSKVGGVATVEGMGQIAAQESGRMSRVRVGSILIRHLGPKFCDRNTNTSCRIHAASFPRQGPLLRELRAAPHSLFMLAHGCVGNALSCSRALLPADYGGAFLGSLLSLSAPQTGDQQSTGLEPDTVLAAPSPPFFKAPENLFGGSGGPWSPCSNPAPLEGGRLFFFHVLHAYFKSPQPLPPHQSKRPPCNKSKTPKASVFTEEPHRITTFRQNVPATGTG